MKRLSEFRTWAMVVFISLVLCFEASAFETIEITLSEDSTFTYVDNHNEVVVPLPVGDYEIRKIEVKEVPLLLEKLVGSNITFVGGISHSWLTHIDIPLNADTMCATSIPYNEISYTPVTNSDDSEFARIYNTKRTITDDQVKELEEANGVQKVFKLSRYVVQINKGELFNWNSDDVGFNVECVLRR